MSFQQQQQQRRRRRQYLHVLPYCCFLLLLVVVHVVTADNNNNNNNNHNNNRNGQYDSEKQQPDKGDPSCTSLEDMLQAIEQGTLPEEMLPPCRDVGDEATDQWDEDHDDSDSYDDYPPRGPSGETTDNNSNSSSSSQPPTAPIGVCQQEGCNSFRFHLYVGTTSSPNLQSLGYLIKPAMTAYLNLAQSQYNYFIQRPSNSEPVDENENTNNNNNDNDNDNNNDDETGDGSSLLLDFALGLMEDLVGNFHPNAVAQLFMVRDDPKLIYDDNNEQQTWWRYRFQYNCHRSRDDAPIFNKTRLAEIRNDTQRVLQDGINLGALQQAMLVEAGYDDLSFDIILQLTRPEIVDQSPPTPPPPESEDTEPSKDNGDRNSTTPTASPMNSTTPVVSSSSSPPEEMVYDVTEWDWRRYLGLGLLLGTVLGTICLTQIAGYRRRKRDQKELWGNLATEEGVDELLRTGWKIKGSKMEIYDKKGVGYKDNDSILIGGFQQREVVGAEITITQPESETTPETTTNTLLRCDKSLGHD